MFIHPVHVYQIIIQILVSCKQPLPPTESKESGKNTSSYSESHWKSVGVKQVANSIITNSVCNIEKVPCEETVEGYKLTTFTDLEAPYTQVSEVSYIRHNLIQIMLEQVRVYTELFTKQPCLLQQFLCQFWILHIGLIINLESASTVLIASKTKYGNVHNNYL